MDEGSSDKVVGSPTTSREPSTRGIRTLDQYFGRATDVQYTSKRKKDVHGSINKSDYDREQGSIKEEDTHAQSQGFKDETAAANYIDDSDDNEEDLELLMCPASTLWLSRGSDLLNNRARLPFDEKPASSQREAKQPSNVNAFDPMKDLFEYFRPKRLYTIDKLMEDRCAHEKITKIKSNMMTEVKKVLYTIDAENERGDGPICSDINDTQSLHEFMRRNVNKVMKTPDSVKFLIIDEDMQPPISESITPPDLDKMGDMTQRTRFILNRFFNFTRERKYSELPSCSALAGAVASLGSEPKLEIMDYIYKIS